MITRWLWNALQTPPSGHPLYQRLYYERNRATWERIRTGLWTVTLMLALLMAFRPQGIFGNKEEMLLDAR